MEKKGSISLMGIVFVIVGVISSSVGFLYLNIKYLITFIQGMELGYYNAYIHMILYCISSVLSGVGIFLMIFGIVKSRTNPQQYGFFPIYASYIIIGACLAIIVPSIGYSFENLLRMSVISSSITFIFTVLGGILIVRPYTTFSKQNERNPTKNKLDSPIFEIIAGFLSIIGAIINFFQIWNYNSYYFSKNDVIAISLGFFAILGGISTIRAAILTRKGNFFAVIMIFFGSWVSLTYTIGRYLIDAFSEYFQGFSIITSVIYAVVLIITQLAGITILKETTIKMDNKE